MGFVRLKIVKTILKLKKKLYLKKTNDVVANVGQRESNNIKRYVLAFSNIYILCSGMLLAVISRQESNFSSWFKLKTYNNLPSVVQGPAEPTHPTDRTDCFNDWWRISFSKIWDQWVGDRISSSQTWENRSDRPIIFLVKRCRSGKFWDFFGKI